MIWFLYGIIYSVFQAFFSELNRIFKIDSWRLNFLHCLFAALACSVCLPFIDIPKDPEFWLIALGSASIMALGCQIQIFMSSKHSGRVSSMWMPISIFVSFIAWTALNPDMAKVYMEDPVALFGILISFSLIIFSIVLIRGNDIGFQALLIMMPVGVLYAGNNVVIKLLLPDQGALEVALAYAFLVYVYMTIFSGAAVFAKKRFNSSLLEVKTLKAGVFIGLSSAFSYLFVLLSLSAAPNPAFTTVLGTLVPVWIMIYHRLRGIPDNASPLAGTAMVVAAIILLFATA